MKKSWWIGACFFCSCAALNGSFSEPTSSDEKLEDANVKTFVSLLQKDDARAKRFAPVLVEKGKLSADLRAQYYLQTCEWRKAFDVIQSLPKERQPVFLAVLTALTSVRRPPREQAMAIAPEVPTWSFRVPEWEVWRDEWSELNVSSMCASLGQEGSGFDAERLRGISQQYFASVSAQDFGRDFNIVALALDVDAPIDGVNQLLQKYEAYQNSPYYQQLQQRVARFSAPLVVSQKGNAIQLGELSFSDVEYRTHELAVPWLVEMQ